MSTLKVIIGAGGQKWEGWSPTHREQLDLCDRATWVNWFGDRRADALLCEHVFEHLTEAEGRAAAAICFEFLQPGGFLRVAVPDAFFPNAEYQNVVKPGGPGPADHPAADHKLVYDYRLLSDVLASAGFSIELLEYCDESGRFTTTNGNHNRADLSLAHAGPSQPRRPDGVRVADRGCRKPEEAPYATYHGVGALTIAWGSHHKTAGGIASQS